MDTQRAAEIQVVLEGMPLPAKKADVLSYAREQDASVLRDLEGLPEEEFRSIDDVGRLLTLVLARPSEGDGMPQPESGTPPGGDDYLEPFPADTGKVRHDAPRTNPPQEAIEQASKTQKRQKAEQEGTS